MLPQRNRHPPTDRFGGLFVQNFSGAELSKILPIQHEVKLDLSLVIGTGDGGQGGRGGDVGCNNVGHQQNHINGPLHIQVAGNQINYNASRLKGGLSSSCAIFV